MANKNKVIVKILGQEYTLVSEDDREYMQKIANYVDDRMVEISKGNKKFSTAMTAVLTALNIADDYMKMKNSICDKDSEILKIKDEMLIREKDLELLNVKLDKKVKEYEELFDKFKINSALEKNHTQVNNDENEYLRDELYKREDELIEAKNLIQEFKSELDKAKVELHETRSQLENTQSEFEQFIETFDGN